MEASNPLDKVYGYLGLRVQTIDEVRAAREPHVDGAGAGATGLPARPPSVDA